MNEENMTKKEIDKVYKSFQKLESLRNVSMPTKNFLNLPV